VLMAAFAIIEARKPHPWSAPVEPAAAAVAPAAK
jgi:hypothetical protein